MKKPDKKKAPEEKEDENSHDLVIWDGTKDSKLNHFVRLLFMKEKDRNKELNQINNRNRKLLEEKAEELMEVTEFYTKKDLLLLVGMFLVIILVCIAGAVFVSLIPGIAATILVAVVLPVEFYPIMRKSMYRIVYNETGFSILYGNKLKCECCWEDIQSQSEIYKFAGNSIYFETTKGRVYVYRTHYGAYPFVKRVQDEYRKIHGRGIPILNIKK